MASNITSLTIDNEYPVAGVDNDSQGFRDNFTIIKDSLAAAKAEVEDLQTKVLLKSALTGDDTLLEDINNMSGGTISQVNVLQGTETVLVSDGVSSPQNISFGNGHYQAVSLTGDITLTLSEWPDEGYAKMRIELSSDSASSRTITLLSENSGEFKVLTSDSWAQVTASSLEVTVPNSTDPVIIDFWTRDGGNKVFSKLLGQFT
jgi:hypothetical protein